jgi:vacuolar-type H+-ATPase subunit D/Vma8
MAIELETLNNEREVLKKDFDNLTQRIAQVEKDLGTMRSNLNAVYGAIQQVDKLINLSSGDTKMSSEKEKALNLATS